MAADISKTSKSFDITFNFDAFLDPVDDDFMQFYLVLEMKNVASFIKTRFY